MEFNSEQKKIIALNQGFHACLAPAGSGKTAILTERIIQALQHGIQPKDMLCLTFTNRAGMNMRDNVSQRLDHQAQGLFIGNIHAFCAKFNHINQTYPKQYLLIDESLSDRLIENSLQEVFSLLKFSPQYIIDTLDKILQHYNITTQHIQQMTVEELDVIRNRIQPKNEHNQYEIWNLKAIRLLILPLISSIQQQLSTEQKGYIREQLRTYDENIHNSLLKYAFAFSVYLHHCYERLKTQYKLYDYDDLIISTLHQLHINPHCKMSSYQWIQVDEVQDLSPLHWLLLKALCQPHAHVVVLGDVNQSIYRFLGASLELTQSKLGKHIHYLKQNYRSPANLVDIFNLYSTQHFNQQEHQCFTNNPIIKQSLLHLHRRYDTEQLIDLADYAYKKIPKDQSTAVLFSRNADVIDFSNILNAHHIKHFIISQHDILDSAPALDFLAFITILHEPQNRLAWARLLWRFGDLTQHRPKHLLEHDPQFAAIRYLAQLQQQGCILSDFIHTKNPYQHMLKQYLQYVEHDKFVFFDTETTGLNPLLDDIIQIAASDQKTSINLYCQTAKSLASSQHIHHIQEETLIKQGKSIAEQLEVFLQFSQNKVLVAHNLDFDDRMLIQHLKRHLPHLEHHYQQQPKLCSLQLCKRLYPQLESYKLADLLEAFELDGENTHNAIDDVYAGQQLLQFLLQKISSNLSELDGLVDLGEACLAEFSRNFSPLWDQVQHSVHKGKFQLHHLFDIFFNYTTQDNFTFADSFYAEKSQELKTKLLNHAQIHFSHLSEQSQYLDKTIEFYKTAKESDLLTQTDTFVISTIHRSKGLEFENVILPSVTDNFFPSFLVKKKLQAHDEYHRKEGLQLYHEQKRLLYVALTRAKKKLIIGTYNLRSAEIGWKYPRNYQISPFLTSISHKFDQI